MCNVFDLPEFIIIWLGSAKNFCLVAFGNTSLLRYASHLHQHQNTNTCTQKKTIRKRVTEPPPKITQSVCRLENTPLPTLSSPKVMHCVCNAALCVCVIETDNCGWCISQCSSKPDEAGGNGAPEPPHKELTELSRARVRARLVSWLRCWRVIGMSASHRKDTRRGTSAHWRTERISLICFNGTWRELHARMNAFVYKLRTKSRVMSHQVKSRPHHGERCGSLRLTRCTRAYNRMSN